MRLDKERLYQLFMDIVTTATEPAGQSAVMWDVVLSAVASTLAQIGDETVQSTNSAAIQAALIISRNRPDAVSVFNDILELSRHDETKFESLFGQDDFLHVVSTRVNAYLGEHTQRKFNQVAARQLAKATPQSGRIYKIYRNRT